MDASVQNETKKYGDCEVKLLILCQSPTVSFPSLLSLYPPSYSSSCLYHFCFVLFFLILFPLLYSSFLSPYLYLNLYPSKFV